VLVFIGEVLKNKNMKTPQLIADSYINGNLSWVKEQCKKDPALIAEVIVELREINNEDSDNFINWMLAW